MDQKYNPNLRNRLSRRDFLRLSGAVAGAAVLSACAGKTPGTVAPAAAPTKAPFKGDLDVWDWEFPVRQTLVNALIDEWKTKSTR